MPVKKKGKKGSGGKKKGKKGSKKSSKSRPTSETSSNVVDERPPLLRPGEKVGFNVDLSTKNSHLAKTEKSKFRSKSLENKLNTKFSL